MIAEDQVVYIGIHGFEHLRGTRAIADDIAKADDLVDLHTADIQQRSLPRLPVCMKIGYDGETHTP